MSVFPNPCHARPHKLMDEGFLNINRLLWSVCENAHNSLTLCDIKITFCIHIYFDIV